MWQEIKRFIERDLFPVIWKYKIQLGVTFTISFWFFLYFIWWLGFSYLPEMPKEDYIIFSIIFFILGIIPALLALELAILLFFLFGLEAYRKIPLWFSTAKPEDLISLVAITSLIILIITIVGTLLFISSLEKDFWKWLKINCLKLPKSRKLLKNLKNFIVAIFIASYFITTLVQIDTPSLKITIIFLLLFLINFLYALYLFWKKIREVSYFFEEKDIDVNLVLITIYFAYISVLIYIGYFARYIGIFSWKNLYLKGEYCYFLQEEGFIKKTDIHKIPVNNIKPSNIWCELKNAYIFWKDSQNIYVHIIKDEYEYSFPIKREVILQEPLIVRKVFKPEKEIEKK